MLRCVKLWLLLLLLFEESAHAQFFLALRNHGNKLQVVEGVELMGSVEVARICALCEVDALWKQHDYYLEVPVYILIILVELGVEIEWGWG